ncbi:MAG: hypothetical protein KIS92_11065 [Planctomycetota bacterium]|nr:hypothetical protein [Planctomycetota bacterium]
MERTVRPMRQRQDRRNAFAFEPEPAPEPRTAPKPAAAPATSKVPLDLPPEDQAVYATRLTPEAFERLPEEMKAAIRAREAKAKRLTEAFTHGFKRRAIIACCMGAVLAASLAIFMPIQNPLMLLLVLAQGAGAGYLIVRYEATPFGSLGMYGGTSVAASLFGFITGWMNWTGAPMVFMSWLLTFSFGMAIAMWARRDRERFNAF